MGAGKSRSVGNCSCCASGSNRITEADVDLQWNSYLASSAFERNALASVDIVFPNLPNSNHLAKKDQTVVFNGQCTDVAEGLIYFFGRLI
jgi:hypothetical protein